jgi:hypothetical protein
VGVRRRVEGAAPIGIERLAELDAAVHAQQIVDGDRVSRILGIAPGRDRRWCLDCELFLPHHDADQRVSDRFGHRPADLRRLGAIAGRIALGDDVAVAQDHHRLGPAMRAALGLRELAVECGFEGGVDRIDGQRHGDVLRRCGRIIVGRGPCRALVRNLAALGAKKDRPAGDQTGEVGCHLPPVAVDAVIHQQPGRCYHGLDRFAIEHVGIKPADKRRRAHLVADIVGGNAGGAVERAAADRARGGGDYGATPTDMVRGQHLGRRRSATFSTRHRAVSPFRCFSSDSS